MITHVLTVRGAEGLDSNAEWGVRIAERKMTGRRGETLRSLFEDFLRGVGQFEESSDKPIIEGEEAFNV